jgi:hypothetical protein
MIIIKIHGGLGNQMFQYATGRRIANDRKVALKLDITAYGNQPSSETVRKFGLQNFNIRIDPASNDEIKKIRYPFGIFSKLVWLIKQKIFRQYNIGFIPSILNVVSDYYLDGYFKNEQYFKSIGNTIRSEFTLKNPAGQASQEAQFKITKSTLPVSLHIRRGDYVQETATALYHGALPIEYYHSAITYLSEKIGTFNLFVFSDDIAWAKENLHLNVPMTFVSQPEIPDYEELLLMSLCKHNIIANSSFSWWGAWLNQNPDKIVIAPKRWLAKTGNDYYKEIPPSWIQL